MKEIILLLALLIFLANITAPRIAITSLMNSNDGPLQYIINPKPQISSKEVMIKTDSSEPTNLQKFVEKLEKEYKYHGLDAIHKDLKDLWAKIVKEENEHNSSEDEANNVQKFLKKLLDDYSKDSGEKIHKDFEDEWERYLKVFGKKYIGNENEMRKEIFKKRVMDVEKHNELYKKGEVSYSAGLNYLSDWTEEEMEKMGGFLPSNTSFHDHPKRVARQVEYNYFYNLRLTVPKSIDWRTKRYVNPVKFQGACGACYAFAGNAALEAYHKKHTGDLVRLSAQNILDCTWDLGNQGCLGGTTFSVFEYARDKGVMSNYWYMYTTNASYDCQWKSKYVAAIDKGFFFIKYGDEMALQYAVANHGPVAVAIGMRDLREYRSGIFDPRNCGPIQHAVLVVGYGTDPEKGDYWIARNSWGYWWGEDGYVRIPRNKNNFCHIAEYATFPY